MLLKVIEKCMLDDEKMGLRVYHYKSNKNNLNDAKLDLLKNFDSDNIIYSDDDFEEDCLDSEILEITMLNE